jgi:hypothetical protein
MRSRLGRFLFICFLFSQVGLLMFASAWLERRLAAIAQHAAEEQQFRQQEQQFQSRRLTEEEIRERIKKLGGKLTPQLHPPERIETIELSGQEVTDDALATLGLEGLEELRSLKLKDTAVTDTGLSCVTKLRELRHLDLDRSRVTDRGMTHLVWAERLHTVQLVETPITDIGLAILSLRHLWKLSVIHCDNVTRDGVDRFRKSQPNCELYYAPKEQTPG